MCAERASTRPPEAAPRTNAHTTREAWLRAGVDELRPYFASCGLTLPDKIRCAIGFPSTGRKGKRLGECWHASSSDDETFEIFIRADLADPVEVLSVLVKELVHTTLPPDSGHGKIFKKAATTIGLQGPMRAATPGVLLKARLAEITAGLGPLPHEILHFENGPLTAVAVAVDRPKKQVGRYRKAECSACGYNVRVVAKWVRVGPPHCPQHGPMAVELPPEDEGGPAAEDQTEAAA